MSLSVIEQAALEQIGRERDALKRRAWEIARAVPDVSEADFRLLIEAEPDPCPDNAFGIKDRLGLIDEYVANCSGFAEFKGLLLMHDVSLVLAFAPELGRPVLTRAEGLALRLRGDRRLWQLEGAADFVEHEPTRDPERGNFVVEERISGTLDGVFLTLRRPIDVRLVDGAYVSTPGAWEVAA